MEDAPRTRRTWWMSGRSVPAVVASTATNLVFCLLFIGLITAAPQANDHFDSVFLAFFLLLIPFNILAAVSSVVALRRYPELVRLPTMPLTTVSNRVLWVCGGLLIAAATIAALFPSHTPAALLVRFAALIGVMIVFNVLNRRGTGWHRREHQPMEPLGE